MSSSLDQCPDCKQEISLSAEICPYCGCQEPFAKDSVRENSTEEQDSLSTEEMPESTDETAPFTQGNQATTQEPSDESAANSGSSYKKWVWPCLVSVLVIGAISVALVWWVNSQRYVLSDSNAHTEILLKIHSADDPEHPGKKLKVSDEAALQLIVILKRRLEAFGCKHKVKKVSNEIISVKLPALRSSELDSIKNDLTYFGKFHFRLSHPNSNALISENAQRARGRRE